MFKSIFRGLFDYLLEEKGLLIELHSFTEMMPKYISYFKHVYGKKNLVLVDIITVSGWMMIVILITTPSFPH